MIVGRFFAGGSVKFGRVFNDRVEVLSRDFLDGVVGATGEVYRMSEVRILAPVKPSKIVGVGLNYLDHIEEMGMERPQEPVIFLKPLTTVIAHNETIIYPKHMTNRLEYEGELAVVIGKKAKCVSVEDAPKYIFGYTILNDVTARDIQIKDKQWTRAKSFDTFSPIGPFVVTDIDPHKLKIETRLNGSVRQSSDTSRMIFNVYELVSFVSEIMTLLPGDVIATGTPSGVGRMEIGDVVEVTIEKIGTLRNVVGGKNAGTCE